MTAHHFFQQTFGISMGSPVSVTFVDLVMEDIEYRAFSDYKTTRTFWKMYMDDILTLSSPVTP